jgi:hypothetical protein
MFKKIWILIFIFSIYISANNYLSSATCSSRTYHKLKNELNLDNIDSKVAPYRAEAFVSLHIYSIDKTRDIGEEFQFGKNHVAKLLEYRVNTKSGFEVGLYKIDNKRYIIAFGGTGSKEKYSQSSMAQDAYTDSVLLSNKETSSQINESAIFLQEMQVKYPNQDITATGHSLGGGLAQFASLMSKQYSSYKKIKAVTFNTAPIPLSNLTKKWVDNLDENLKWADANNVNFMTNNDPLTNILKSAENYSGYDLKNFNINTGIPLLDSFLNKLEKGKEFKSKVFTLAQIYMNQTVRDIKKTIYGKRIILNTNTGHSMVNLLKKLAPDYANYGAFRHGFVDVPVGNDGYCKVLKLMKSHVISYPRSERNYKYYPNRDTTNYEVALYVVNNFFYLSYRGALESALKEKKSLSKFDYFIQKFSDVMGIYPVRDRSMSFRTFTNIMREVYKSKIKSYPTYLTVEAQDRKDVLEGILTHIEASMFGIVRFINTKESELDKPITRMQMTKWIVDSLEFNYLKLIKREQDTVKNIRLLKLTGKGSTDRVLKSDFIDVSY